MRVCCCNPACGHEHNVVLPISAHNQLSHPADVATIEGLSVDERRCPEGRDWLLRTCPYWRRSMKAALPEFLSEATR